MPPPAPAAPVSVEIHDVAFGGNGVARDDGKVVFVPFTIPGERVRAQIVRQRKNFAEADLIEVETASPDRVEPACPYFARCGGCAYQHITYPRQLAIKQQQVEQTLRRVGRLSDVPMRPIVAAPREYAYRNRIRVHVAGGVAGFYAHGARSLVDVERCAIASAQVNEALHSLRHSPIHDGDYSLRASGGGPFFEQTNPEVTKLMLETVRALVPAGGSALVDAYCGAGLFAKYLADLFADVTGIEENANAIEHARRRTQPNEHYLHGSVEMHLGDVLAAREAAETVVILDPPATGITPRVADVLMGVVPAQVVYVSCNPGTLARDLALLTRVYRLESVTALDMFPQTAEIEVVAHLRHAAGT